MAAFNTFLDILPDPDISIGDAGQEGGTAGQGFVSAELSRDIEYTPERTLSGRTLRRRSKYPMWNITLQYNPLTQAQFAPIHAFLMQKQNGLRPFFVELPQYKLPKNSGFAAYIQGTSNITTSASQTAGQTYIDVTKTDSDTNLPFFGDLFNINDINDSLHTKAYMVDRVEVFTGNLRVYFSPGLMKDVSSSTEVVFENPKIFVRQVGGVQAYELDNDGLYGYTLKLQEVTY